MVTTNITADLTGAGGFLLGGPIRKNFTNLLKGFVKDWKVYAETNDISETKKREIANPLLNRKLSKLNAKE
jgi:hypothetical protein